MREINVDSNFLGKLKRSKFKILPFVLAASMLSGCGAKADSFSQSGKNFVPKVAVDMKRTFDNQNLLNYYMSGWGYDGESVGDNFYRIKADHNHNIFYCESLDEFREYVDVKNPTYDDVRNAVKENPNIVGDYETWILYGLNALEEKMPDLDLVVLYYNVKRFSFVESTVDEIIAKIGSPGAWFSIEDGKIYICPSSIGAFSLCHEVLGHGITDIMIEKDGKQIYYRPDWLLLYADVESSDYYFEYTGFSLEEGKADLIADIAIGLDGLGPYDMQAEQLRIFMEISGVSLSDYIKFGTSYLVEKMRENDIDRPIDYIRAIDAALRLEREHKFELPSEYTMKNNVVSFFEDYADDKIIAGVPVDSVKAEVTAVLQNTTNSWISLGSFFMLDYVEMDELLEAVLSSIDEIEASSVKTK